MVTTKSCIWTVPRNDSIYFSAVFFRGVYVLMFCQWNKRFKRKAAWMLKKISTLLKRALRLLFSFFFLRNILSAASTAHCGKERWQPLWIAFAPRISQARGDVVSALQAAWNALRPEGASFRGWNARQPTIWICELQRASISGWMMLRWWRIGASR